MANDKFTETDPSAFTGDEGGDRMMELLKKIPVVSVAEAENCDAVVCGPNSYFPDDVHATCHYCAAPIVHRPYMPKKALKICMTCFAIEAGREKTKGGTDGK